MSRTHRGCGLRAARQTDSPRGRTSELGRPAGIEHASPGTRPGVLLLNHGRHGLVGREGFEPPTPGSTGRRSCHSSYRASVSTSRNEDPGAVTSTGVFEKTYLSRWIATSDLPLARNRLRAWRSGARHRPWGSASAATRARACPRRAMSSSRSKPGFSRERASASRLHTLSAWRARRTHVREDNSREEVAFREGYELLLQLHHPSGLHSISLPTAPSQILSIPLHVVAKSVLPFLQVHALLLPSPAQV